MQPVRVIAPSRRRRCTGARLTLLLVIENLLRAATAVALTALPLTPASPAFAGERPVAPRASPCDAVVAPAGSVCVPSPKQCITTPCPQYDLVAIPFYPLPSGGGIVTPRGAAGTP
ncbi:hypothetical protein GCM10015535_42660 [Streptomyces gelaticus]|uniref:Chaplin n=1 Tax=Streptomyces gelaticus TaxID=285446 RepID=A0ABQ2W2H2_9ACTN|nr:hypothetical protein GCM10015535_42660 [Streptomyces gelaticus]